MKKNDIKRAYFQIVKKDKGETNRQTGTTGTTEIMRQFC
jgi:hypothetical protein